MEEFNKLKASYDKLKQEVDELKAMMREQQTVPPPQTTVNEKEFRALENKVAELEPALSKFVLTGYGYTDYTNAEGSASTFTAGFNPVFLWHIRDDLLFESELELEITGDTAEVHLEHADLQYEFNDYITLGIGKFISPFGIFNSRFEPKFANKLPDKPYGIEDATMLEPESQIGAEVHGGIPLPKKMSMNYGLYISNGPLLETGADNAGDLSFVNSTDNNNNKAFGGRIGFIPIPDVEVGYSFETSTVGSKDTAYSGVDALLQSVDFSYVHDIEPIRGTLRFFAENIWSKVDSIDYGIGGGAFDNDRSARYAQISYRPTMVDIRYLKNIEGVFRFDEINEPGDAPTNTDLRRYTWGLDYWFNPRTVLKFAYELEKQVDYGTNDHTFIMEFAVGF